MPLDLQPAPGLELSDNVIAQWTSDLRDDTPPQPDSDPAVVACEAWAIANAACERAYDNLCAPGITDPDYLAALEDHISATLARCVYDLMLKAMKTDATTVAGLKAKIDLLYHFMTMEEVDPSETQSIALTALRDNATRLISRPKHFS